MSWKFFHLFVPFLLYACLEQANEHRSTYSAANVRSSQASPASGERPDYFGCAYPSATSKDAVPALCFVDGQGRVEALPLVELFQDQDKLQLRTAGFGDVVPTDLKPRHSEGLDAPSVSQPTRRAEVDTGISVKGQGRILDRAPESVSTPPRVAPRVVRKSHSAPEVVAEWRLKQKFPNASDDQLRSFLQLDELTKLDVTDAFFDRQLLDVVYGARVKEFDAYAKYLQDSMLVAKQARDRITSQTLSGKLTNLGKVKKEAEYLAENHLQQMRLWQLQVEQVVGLSDNADILAVLRKGLEHGNMTKLRGELRSLNLSQDLRAKLNGITDQPFVAIARPIEDVGYQKIALGFDGKPVNMKGKSSKVTGFIPKDQRLSKLSERFMKRFRNGEKVDDLIEEMKLYQGKSDVKIIEPDFLPTTVFRPHIEVIAGADGSRQVNIGVIQKFDMENLNAENFKDVLSRYESGLVDTKKVQDLFDDFQMKRFDEEGESYIAELIASGKMKQTGESELEVVFHHATPRTIASNEVIEEFSDQQFREMRAYLETQKKMDVSDFRSHEDFERSVGRGKAEELRTEFNKSLGDDSLERRFLDFVLAKEGIDADDLQRGRLLYRSTEISADVDTFDKSAPGLLNINNFSYNVTVKSSDNAADFEARFQRSDAYDVSVHYPIPPDVLWTSGIPTRLSKHLYENKNTRFAQDLLQDYPLTVQVMGRDGVQILRINKGPPDDPHRELMQYLEQLTEHGIFIPLNPVDVTKNFKHYEKSLANSPNLARFYLKYLDDYMTPAATAKVPYDELRAKMYIKNVELENLEVIYKHAKNAISNDPSKLSPHLKEVDGYYDAMIDRLDGYFKSPPTPPRPDITP